MKEFKQNIISDQLPVRQALEVLNKLKGRDFLTLFVIGTGNRLVGTLTDGDVRRGLIKGKDIEKGVTVFMNSDFRYLEMGKYSIDDIETLRKEEIELVPLLSNDKVILQIIDISRKKSLLPLDAVIMAGGEGQRLRPLTLKTPKPLLKIGDKAIIEYSIDHLINYGISNFHITVRYLGEQIKKHLGDGSEKGIHIQYIDEDAPLGTIGAVSAIPGFENDAFLVMNSDLLTNIDLLEFYLLFKSSGADIAMATIPYHVAIPYGVIEINGDLITSIKEKPNYTYYSNGGIYLFKKQVQKLIPKNRFFNATDMIEKAIESGLKLVNYPISGYWKDIGSMEEYTRAMEDVKHMKI